jgi:hypothetical protein
MVAARAALADDFATNCIFLGGEFQGGEGGTKELAFCSRMPRESLITNAELDVAFSVVTVYSPECKREKKAMTIMSAMAMVAESVEALAN